MGGSGLAGFCGMGGSGLVGLAWALALAAPLLSGAEMLLATGVALVAGPPTAFVAFCVCGLLAVAVVPLRTVNCLNSPGLSLTSPVETLISTNGLAMSSIISNRFWCSSAELMSSPRRTNDFGSLVFRFS